MPELPEVQTIVDELNQNQISGKQILDVNVLWDRTIHCPSSKEFCKILKGKKIQRISRRAKYLVFQFQNKGYLLVHLRMTGQFSIQKPGTQPEPHIRVVIKFQDKELHYKDTRKFGRLYYVEEEEEILGKIGPEPLEMKAGDLFPRLNKYNRMLKPLLLDQEFLAGLGNIYVDEALFESKLHPCSSSASVTEKQSRQLMKNIQLVLNRGLNNLGTSLGTGAANYYSVSGRSGRNQDQLGVFRKTGQPCPRCSTTIKRILVGQRSTHICPKCQKQK